jgi:hypothetical protein
VGRIARQIADSYWPGNLEAAVATPATPADSDPAPVSRLKEYAGNYYSDELDVTYI